MLGRLKVKFFHKESDANSDNAACLTSEINHVDNFVIQKGKAYRFISINPDLKTEFGHYLSFDLRLKNVILKEDGDFLILGNKEVDKALVEKHGIIPVFSEHSWDLSRDETGMALSKFSRELKSIIEFIEANDKKTENTYYFYLSYHKHILPILEVAEKSNLKNNFVLNLFWDHLDILENGSFDSLKESEIIDAFNTTFERRKKLNVKLCVDSDKLQNILLKSTGEKLPVQPMFSVTEFKNEELQIKEEINSGLEGRPSPFLVYSPGNLRFEKGYDLVSELVLKAKKDGSLTSSFIFRVREVTAGISKKLEKALKKHIKRMRRNADVIAGILEPEEYKRLLREADIVLIPYRKRDFYSRTSAVFSDSVILSKPIVATKDTWIGDYVDELGIGETFLDGNVDDFYKALQKVKNNYNYYCNNNLHAKRKWLEENNVEKFVDFILVKD